MGLPMGRSVTGCVVLRVVLLVASICSVVAQTTVTRAPHVLFVVMDDLGWGDVSLPPHNAEYETPHIDQLMSTGVRFDQFYVHPLCTPTRAAFMTGRYAFHTGMQSFKTLVPGSNASLPKSDPTLAEVLADGGYRTAMIGKWHLGFSHWSDTPLGRGFESFVGFLDGQITYYNHSIKGPTTLPFTTTAYDFWANRTVCASRASLGPAVCFVRFPSVWRALCPSESAVL